MAAGKYRPTFETRTEPVAAKVTELFIPDKSWSFTDGAGHVHTPGEDCTYPTIKIVKTGEYWCDACREMHDHEHYACKICDQKIPPGGMIKTTSTLHYAPEPRSYFIDGTEVTEHDFQARLAAYLEEQ